MRIVVSGTHGTGKSTLIADFARRHPEYTVLPDPFELIDESWDLPGVEMFTAQLRLSAERLIEHEGGENVIAERGPIDFLAYLLAAAELAGGQLPAAFQSRAIAMTASALDEADILVVLPLTPDLPPVGDDEDRELRATMDEVLLDLIDDPAVVGETVRVADISGDPAARLAELERLMQHVSGAAAALGF